MIVRPGSTPNSHAAQFDLFRAGGGSWKKWGRPPGTCAAISRQNPQNFEKIRLPRARILPQSPWGPTAMARHRRPAVIRKREGNPGKRPIPNEIAGRGKPRCPDHLSDDQKRCWQAVVRALPEGILTSAAQSE